MWDIIHSEDGGSMVLRNVGILPQHSSQLRRPRLESTYGTDDSSKTDSSIFFFWGTPNRNRPFSVVTIVHPDWKVKNCDFTSD